MMTQVRIVELTGSYRVRVSAHRTADENEAIQKAITKHFGSRAYFWRDAGLPVGNYGQIAVASRKAGGDSTITDRIRIDVARVS